jgi:hypothetical protein
MRFKKNRKNLMTEKKNKKRKLFRMMKFKSLNQNLDKILEVSIKKVELTLGFN